MSFLPLLTIPTFFLVAVLIKPWITKKVHWNVCAICVAVSLTWVVLLGLFWSGIQVDVVSLAVLMGMSVTGIMYKLEGIYRARRLRSLWVVRLVVILGGFGTVVLLLDGTPGAAFLVGIVSGLLVVTVSFLLQGTKREELTPLTPEVTATSLQKNLDNCC